MGTLVLVGTLVLAGFKRPCQGRATCVGRGAGAGLPQEPCHPPGEVKGRGVTSTVGFLPGHDPTHEKVTEKQASVPLESHSICRSGLQQTQPPNPASLHRGGLPGASP